MLHAHWGLRVVYSSGLNNSTIGILTKATGSFGYTNYDETTVTPATKESSYVQGRIWNGKSTTSGLYIYEDLSLVKSVTIKGTFSNNGSNWNTINWNLDTSGITGKKYIVIAGWVNVNMAQYHLGAQIQNSAIFDVSVSTIDNWCGNNEGSADSYIRITDIIFNY